jgi:hypothetical protein
MGAFLRRWIGISELFLFPLDQNMEIGRKSVSNGYNSIFWENETLAMGIFPGKTWSF